MYPHERSLVKQLAGKPFVLIGVNSDGDIDKLKEIIIEKNLTWRSFQNDEGKDGVISDMWGIQGWPTIFIIDAEGVIRFKAHGGDFDSVIENLLADMGHEVEIKKVGDEEDEADGDAEVDSEAEADGEKELR